MLLRSTKGISINYLFYTKLIVAFFCAVIIPGTSFSQSYFSADRNAGPLHNFRKSISFSGPNTCISNDECMWQWVGLIDLIYHAGLAVSPDLKLYASNEPGIYLIDTLNGNSTLFFSHSSLPNFPSPTNVEGLVSIGNGIFYTSAADNPFGPYDLFRIDVTNSSSLNLGTLLYNINGDITLFNGEFFYATQLSSNPFQFGIVKLDVNNATNSNLILTLSPGIFIRGLTASSFCNTLIGTDDLNNKVYYINIIDGSMEEVCSAGYYTRKISSYQEHLTPNCNISIDLDCNDSSGATDADFNSDEIDCLDKEASVSDSDIGMIYDAIISEMRIEITGLIPDAPLEILTSTGSVTNIDITGDGTDMITLANAGGAKSTDFKDALQLIRYQNNAASPTGGIRTVEVQFETESGSESNVATAFINVVELPLVPVDLGADVQICDGESVTIDAGIPGVDYEWSTGDDTQTIIVDVSGEYTITVSDGVNCPGSDTLLVEVLPVINVSLSGDTEICDNEPVNLIINTDTPFSLAIDIASNPGNPFSFPDVNGNFPFTDLINEETTYTITSVTPSQDACITITDPEHIVDVYTSFNHAFEVSICDGDSVWLGVYWETEAGVYENTFSSLDDCDSIVTTTIIIVPSIQISTQGTTCDSAEVGVFITTIDNPNGCDTTITTTITLASGDTTQLTGTSCIFTQTGITSDTLSNLAGCDSLIISTISYIPPSDTTFVNVTTCDSAQLGIAQLILPSNNGCDSLIITTTTFASLDTSYVSGISCDSASMGVFYTLLQNQLGCDSLVILTVTAGIPDTTYTSTTSCDSSSLGMFEYHFTNFAGCDSVVFQTVTYSAVDSIFLNGSSCDATQSGVFVSQYVNQFGCDSIVTTTISLLPSDTVEISGSTCDPDEAGVSIANLHNVFGCDSIVTTFISLLPSSITDLFETTCISSEAGVFVSTLINEYGCDSIVTLTVSLVDADTTLFTYMTCFESEVGVTESLYTGHDGCDSLVIEQTLTFPLSTLDVVSVYDYNGYDVSCLGGSDGAVEAIIVGENPFTFLWSNSETGQRIEGVAVGNYSVTVMDSNGCVTSDSIELSAASAFAIAFTISEPDCFDQELGSIGVMPSGGVAPYTFSIDGTTFQSDPIFVNLGAGIYQITALDANECDVTEIISIHVPLSVQVELGNDKVIAIGDSTILQAVINLPFDSLATMVWTSNDNSICPTCLIQIVYPVITTAYSVEVTSVDGCADQDSVNIFVSTRHDVYVPNIFSPNGDGYNDVLTISASEGVEQITSFEIFDRWGNLVFEVKNITPGSSTINWDGRFQGEDMNSGVFTYLMKVENADGTSDTKYGDITLLR